MLYKKLFFICLLIFGYFAKAQSGFVKSTLVLVSEDKNGQATKYAVEDTYMILNISNGDFTLNTDLSDIKTGNRNTDSIIQSNGTQALTFSGNISENLLAFNQQQNDERTYSMPGMLRFNSSSIACVAQFDPINLAEKSETKNYRMDFTLSVDASRINIKGFEGAFSKQVVFELVAGKLNIQQ